MGSGEKWESGGEASGICGIGGGFWGKTRGVLGNEGFLGKSGYFCGKNADFCRKIRYLLRENEYFWEKWIFFFNGYFLGEN